VRGLQDFAAELAVKRSVRFEHNDVGPTLGEEQAKHQSGQVHLRRCMRPCAPAPRCPRLPHSASASRAPVAEAYSLAKVRRYRITLEDLDAG
jgi:hypothetical protein